MMKGSLFFTLPLLLFASCKKNPIDRLTNPVPEGSVSQSSGIFIIYDDDLKTGGGLGLIPGGENQSINLEDFSNPRRTARQIRYHWNGGDVNDATLNTSSHTFAGFSLLITPDFSTYDSATARDFSVSGSSYTKLTMYIRGELSEGNSLRIEGPSSGVSGFIPARTTISASDLSTSWQRVTITVPTVDFASVKIFATFSFQYVQPPRTTSPGNGGVIYVDDIHYER